MDENIIFQSQGIEISEDKSNPDYLQGLFKVCSFDTNLNNVRLNRDTIEEWVSTIVGTPLVAKITKKYDGKEDFGSHGYKVISKKCKNGKIQRRAVFDTDAFGFCTDAYIEADKDGNEYIYAKYKIWKRFENACRIIKERAENLHTSWEISVEKSSNQKDGDEVVKQIDKGRFIGLAMLSKDVTPAYSCSGLLEVAAEEDNEMFDALVEDIMSEASEHTKSTKKEEENIVDIDKDVNVVVSEDDEVKEENNNNTLDLETETSEESLEAEEVKENEKAEEENEETSEENKEEDDNSNENDEEVKTSAILMREAMMQIEEAIRDSMKIEGYISYFFVDENIAWFKAFGGSELDYLEIRFSYADEQVVIEEITPIKLVASPRDFNVRLSEKDNEISSLSEKITSLENEVSCLKPYKEAAEKAEHNLKVSELTKYAVNSKLISEDECLKDGEVKDMISALDKDGINSLIASRYIESISCNNTKNSEDEVNTSSVEKQADNIVADIMPDDESTVNIVKAYINSK